LEKCLDYWGRYHEMEEKGGAQLFSFTNDVAKHITGDPSPPNDPPPLIEAMIIGEIFPLLYLSVCMVVADAFGDSKPVAKLKNDYQKKMNIISFCSQVTLWDENVCQEKFRNKFSKRVS
jgi:hypothetical protein